MELDYLTDEHQRLVAHLNELREQMEDGDFVGDVKWTIIFPNALMASTVSH